MPFFLLLLALVVWCNMALHFSFPIFFLYILNLLLYSPFHSIPFYFFFFWLPSGKLQRALCVYNNPSVPLLSALQLKTWSRVWANFFFFFLGSGFSERERGGGGGDGDGADRINCTVVYYKPCRSRYATLISERKDGPG